MATGATYIEGATGNVTLADIPVSDANLTATDLEAALAELASRVAALEP